jgi:predicted ATP-grasp superfamily ATP-dependent carboligase
MRLRPVRGRAASIPLDVDTTTPAIVLKLDPNVFHHGGLGVIRSLGRLGIPTYAVHDEAFTPAASSRYLRGGWLWSPDRDDADQLREGLIRLAEHIGRPAVLIPTDDVGAIFLAEHGQDLRQWFLFPAPDPSLPRRVADKYELYRLCRDRGLPCVATTVAHSAADVTEFVERTGLPIVVKLSRPWSRRSASPLRSTTLARTRDELTQLYRWHEHEAGGDGAAGLLLQEYIPGGQGHDWFFHGYCDATSTCRPSFTGVKERSYPVHAGLTSLGRSKVNQRLAEEVGKMLVALSYRGVMDLDLRWDARDGQYKLLDFNPRLGAQFRLFRDDIGVDVAVAAHLDLTGRPVPEGRQVAERGFLVENYDPIAAFGYWRRGELGPWSWLRSVRGVDELAWFAADDLAPFGLMCLRMCWRVLERPFGHRFQRAGPPQPRYQAGRSRAARSPGTRHQPASLTQGDTAG